jgi:1-acyl-sn-glycerol-3-phosphate acyltransferase
MPPRGGLIVAGNHASWLDTVFLGCAGTRLIHYMAASEFYDRWYFKWIMWLYGTIPVERGKGKRVPYHKAVMLLRRGRALGVFPEGRMSRSGKLQPFQGGMALLSVETGAPILPVAVIGGFEVMGSSKRFPRPRKVRVRIGQPIYPAGLSRDEILSRVETSIRTLLSLTSV